MTNDFHIMHTPHDSSVPHSNWVVMSQAGLPLIGFRRQAVAEAYGKALAHRAGVSLLVHEVGDRCIRYSGRDLSYSASL